MSQFLRKILVFAVFFTLLSASQGNAEPPIIWENVCSGYLDADILNSGILAGQFTSAEGSSIVLWRSGEGPDFSLLSPGTQSYTGERTFDVGGVTPGETPWFAADVDGDGMDELLFFQPGDLFRVDLDGGEKTVSYGLFPKTVISAAALQIDGDAPEELVLLYHTPEGKETDRPTPMWVGIWDFDDSGCRFLWTDNGKLGFVDPDFCPPDVITCTGDPLGKGIPTVLILMSQSDVSPSRYRALFFEKERLVAGPAFSISGGEMQPDGIYDDSAPFIVANLDQIRSGEKTLLLASLVGEGYAFSKNIISLDGSTFSDLGPVTEMNPSDRFFWFPSKERPLGVIRLMPGQGQVKNRYQILAPASGKISYWQTLTRPCFSMEIPAGAEVTDTGDTVRVDLPRTPGTMLDERSVSVTVSGYSDAASCLGDLPEEKTVTVSGLVFRVLPGFKWEADMGGKRFYMAEYGTVSGGKCIRITFRLLMRDLTGFSDAPPRPAPPEEEIDTEVFRKMLGSFRLTCKE